jgi:hypothetical protein
MTAAGRVKVGKLECFALEQTDGILIVVQNMETNEGRARFIPTADVAGMSDFRLGRILEELSNYLRSAEMR